MSTTTMMMMKRMYRSQTHKKRWNEINDDNDERHMSERQSMQMPSAREGVCLRLYIYLFIVFVFTFFINLLAFVITVIVCVVEVYRVRWIKKNCTINVIATANYSMYKTCTTLLKTWELKRVQMKKWRNMIKFLRWLFLSCCVYPCLCVC